MQNQEQYGYLQPWLLEQWNLVPPAFQNLLIPEYAQYSEYWITFYLVAQTITIVSICLLAKDRRVPIFWAMVFAIVAQFPLNLLVWIIIAPKPDRENKGTARSG